MDGWTGRRSSCVDNHTLCPGCWPIGHCTWFFIFLGGSIWIFRGLSTAEISGRWYLFLMMMALRGLNSMEVQGVPSSWSTKRLLNQVMTRFGSDLPPRSVNMVFFLLQRARIINLWIGDNLKQHDAMSHNAEFLTFESACLQSLPSWDRVYSICHFWTRFQPVTPSLAPVMVLQLALIPNLSIWESNLDYTSKLGVFAVQQCKSPPHMVEKVHALFLVTAESYI